VAPLKVSVPATKSVTTVKWLCSCNVNPVTLFGRGARSCSREDYYSGHFLRPPTDVSLFCPGGHLPDALVSGFPLPGRSSIAAYETPLTPNAIDSEGWTDRTEEIARDVLGELPTELRFARCARPVSADR
jgi:hypothetical protein